MADEARASGRAAADRAVAIDNRNSEALYIKGVLLDPRDWIGKEELFKRAIAARRLDCGCEHHQYGGMLLKVGRTAEAVEQLHQANEMLALYVYTPLWLAEALVAAGKPEDAKQFFDAAIDLAPNAVFARRFTAFKAMAMGDTDLLRDPALEIPAEQRAAMLQAFRALASRDSVVRAQAVKALLALPEDQKRSTVAKLLARFGANHEAFEIASRVATGASGTSLLWDPSMRGTLDDPGFPALVTQLGLVEYWKATHTKPDVCSETAPPAFCGMI